MKRCFYRFLAVVAACFAAPWAAWHQRRIKKNGRPLNHSELEFAERLGLNNTETIRVHVVERVPNPLYPLLCLVKKCGGSCITKAAGITLGHGIYVSKECEHSAELIAHELVHVAQYQRAESIWAFMVEYIHQCLLVGYHDADWEKEARKESVRVLSNNT